MTKILLCLDFLLSGFIVISLCLKKSDASEEANQLHAVGDWVVMSNEEISLLLSREPPSNADLKRLFLHYEFLRNDERAVAIYDQSVLLKYPWVNEYDSSYIDRFRKKPSNQPVN